MWLDSGQAFSDAAPIPHRVSGPSQEASRGESPSPEAAGTTEQLGRASKCRLRALPVAGRFRHRDLLRVLFGPGCDGENPSL